MRKIGNQNILYPMPVVIVAAKVDGKVNFINIAHVGILNAQAPHLISLGMNKSHYTNQGIRENKVFSVNLMSEEHLVAVDYVGIASGKNADKSNVWETFEGESGAPIIQTAALSMECELADIYDAKSHDLFIGRVLATYADDKVLTDGKPDLAKVKPLLFDMASVQYWSIGEKLGGCWKEGRNYGK